MKFDSPIFFAQNRVWRLYTGGKMLDQFEGNIHAHDSHFPEEWLASTVYANNGEHALRPDEGLAKVISDKTANPSLRGLLRKYGKQILGQKHFAKYGDSTAVLCKYLDAAVRLPIQCHPDALTASTVFGSCFGKEECWHIISTRKINGEDPYILLGFKPGITSEAFTKAVFEQDLPKMTSMLHKIHVIPGETYFVPGRIPHAIGPGVFMLEVQEPSDFCIQPERYCADIQLNDNDMWNALSPEQALQVFDYTGVDYTILRNKVAPSNNVIYESDDLRIVELIGNQHTNAFGLWHACITGTTQIKLPTESAIIVVKKGGGTVQWSDKSIQLRQSDYFLKPAALKELECSSNETLELLLCLPPTIYCSDEMQRFGYADARI
jgi:mannose-6-phosphate isomerase